MSVCRSATSSDPFCGRIPFGRWGVHKIISNLGRPSSALQFFLQMKEALLRKAYVTFWYRVVELFKVCGGKVERSSPLN